MNLGTQLFITASDALREEVTPVKNRHRPSRAHKPQHGTGLWTSTYDEATGSEWAQSGRGVDGPHWYLLAPKEDARLYEIDSLADLLRLMEQYPYGTCLGKELQTLILNHPYTASAREDIEMADIDFERLAQDYDALHLTSKGEETLHLTFPIDLNGWDVESTVWFRWCFSSVQRIEPKIREEVS